MEVVTEVELGVGVVEEEKELEVVGGGRRGGGDVGSDGGGDNGGEGGGSGVL